MYFFVHLIAVRCIKSQYFKYADSTCVFTAECTHVCKCLCHLSTFQQDSLKGDSQAPVLPPSFSRSLVLSPSPSSVSLSLMTKLLGGPSDRSDPCAWADVNSLMVSVLLPLRQAFLCSADVSHYSCRGRVE